jgi:nucleotide-binding universal stress UspA family protein
VTAPIAPIVVGFDGSRDARRAASWAGAAARARPGTPVHLVHALTLPPIPFPAPSGTVEELIARHESEQRALLDGARSELAASGVAAAVFLRRWLPVETLLDHARDRGAQLLVVGQRGDRATRLLLGSVSSALARAAELPTVVVRGECGTAPPARVLLALDGSAAAAHAAAAAARWSHGAHCLAVHVRTGDAEIDEAALRRQLEGAAPELARAPLRIVDGPLVETLLALAESEQIDLVAAGRRGLARWTELLLGGVSEKLVQLAPCPVLLAH